MAKKPLKMKKTESRQVDLRMPREMLLSNHEDPQQSDSPVDLDISNILYETTADDSSPQPDFRKVMPDASGTAEHGESVPDAPEMLEYGESTPESTDIPEPSDGEIHFDVETDAADISATDTQTSGGDPFYVPAALSELPRTGPFLHGANSVRTRMADVGISLLPLLLWAVYVYGTRVLTVTVLSVACCMLTELWICLLLRRPVTLSDGSAAVSGLVLSCLLPACCPFWMPALGGFIAMAVKHAFGGLGKNWLNPALSARLALGILFPAQSAALPQAGVRLSWLDTAVQANGVSPLSALHDGVLPDLSLGNAFIGNFSGPIGTVSALLILCGALYLIGRRVISWRIPLAYTASFFLLSLLFSRSTDIFSYALYELFCGGVLFGAVWLACDSVTSPVTRYGRLIYGAGCAFLHFVCRQLFPALDGMAIGILLMNLLARPMDVWLHPVRLRQMRQNRVQKRQIRKITSRTETQ